MINVRMSGWETEGIVFLYIFFCNVSKMRHVEQTEQNIHCKFMFVLNRCYNINHESIP